MELSKEESKFYNARYENRISDIASSLKKESDRKLENKLRKMYTGDEYDFINNKKGSNAMEPTSTKDEYALKLLSTWYEGRKTGGETSSKKDDFAAKTKQELVDVANDFVRQTDINTNHSLYKIKGRNGKLIDMFTLKKENDQIVEDLSQWYRPQLLKPETRHLYNVQHDEEIYKFVSSLKKESNRRVKTNGKKYLQSLYNQELNLKNNIDYKTKKDLLDILNFAIRSDSSKNNTVLNNTMFNKIIINNTMNNNKDAIKIKEETNTSKITPSERDENKRIIDNITNEDTNFYNYIVKLYEESQLAGKDSPAKNESVGILESPVKHQKEKDNLQNNTEEIKVKGLLDVVNDYG